MVLVDARASRSARCDPHGRFQSVVEYSIRRESSSLYSWMVDIVLSGLFYYIALIRPGQREELSVFCKRHGI